MFGQKDDNASDQDNNPAENHSEEHAHDIEPTPVSGEGVAESAPVASAATAPPADDPWQHPDSTEDVISPAGGFPSSASKRLRTSGPVLTFNSDDDIKKDEADAAAMVTNNDTANSDLV